MRASILSLFFSGTVVLVGACSDSDPGARVNSDVLPRGPEFRPVAQVFVDSCASLDCHGSKYRNMHLYGYGSTRIDPKHQPDAPDTTDDEVNRDYDSVVSVEPEITRAVAMDRGFHPERLTFIRKGRGAEAHKGGIRLVPGQPADDCILSWLSGTVNAAVCRSAVPRLDQP
jgi:hypothetical protein